jgi:hypothetical protein
VRTTSVAQTHLVEEERSHRYKSSVLLHQGNTGSEEGVEKGIPTSRVAAIF